MTTGTLWVRSRTWLFVSFIAVVVGVGGGWFTQSLLAPPVYLNLKPVQLLKIGPYTGMYITRERNGWCSLHPSRVIFTQYSFAGKSVPLVLPLPTDGFIWPTQGKAEFIVLMKIPADLPAGQWYIQTIIQNSCHWWNWFVGPNVVESNPISVTLPVK